MVLLVTLLELALDACRWPVGEDEDEQHLFCGEAVAREGAVYCAVHASLAYVPVRRPERRRATSQDLKIARVALAGAADPKEPRS